jgi:hypothetical protein
MQLGWASFSQIQLGWASFSLHHKLPPFLVCSTFVEGVSSGVRTPMATPVQDFSPLKTRGMRSDLQTPLSNHDRQSQGDLYFFVIVNLLFRFTLTCF